jgi:predicted RNA-binding protein with PUA-like domain
MNYWLIKSEPGCFSYDDLVKAKKEPWDGVRNYQARNFLQAMEVGDLAIFYHSNAKPAPHAVGVCKIVTKAYPDHTAWDSKSEHPDPKSTPEKPIWYMPDVAPVQKFEQIVELKDMKAMPQLEGMKLIQRGCRLSVMPVTKKHFDTVCKMGGVKI